MVTGLTLADIAARYDRPRRTIEYWRRNYDWPEPAGKRGRWDTYDPDEVDQAVRAILALSPGGGDPDELLDIKQAAEEAGITPATIRSYLSREPGRYWPAPDAICNGTRVWKRSTVRAHMAARRPNKNRPRQETSTTDSSDPGGSLTTRSERRLIRIGGELSKGGLMPGELADQALAVLTEWAAGYTQDLGDGVLRRLAVTDTGDDFIELDVRLTGYRAPEHRYRLAIGVTELEA